MLGPKTPSRAAILNKMSAEDLLDSIVAAANAADPKILDQLVWGAASLGDASTLRLLLRSGGGGLMDPELRRSSK